MLAAKAIFRRVFGRNQRAEHRELMRTAFATSWRGGVDGVGTRDFARHVRIDQPAPAASLLAAAEAALTSGDPQSGRALAWSLGGLESGTAAIRWIGGGLPVEAVWLKPTFDAPPDDGEREPTIRVSADQMSNDEAAGISTNVLRRSLPNRSPAAPTEAALPAPAQWPPDAHDPTDEFVFPAHRP